MQKSFKGQFKAADRAKAKFSLLIGEDELNSQMVTVKNKITRQQETVPADQLIDYLDQAFGEDEDDHDHDHDHHHETGGLEE